MKLSGAIHCSNVNNISVAPEQLSQLLEPLVVCVTVDKDLIV